MLPDGPGALCGWGYTPTNFDPCMLPAGAIDVALTGAATLDTGSPVYAHASVTQSDGSSIVVIHVSSLSIASGATLTVSGTLGAIFAVEGDVHVDGAIVVTAGRDDAVRCATARGSAGADSTNYNGGGGGGGGGGGAAAGGAGTSGAGTGPGALGAAGGMISSAASLSPLRGGCPGGQGGRVMSGQGTNPPGGHGGGSLQISARGTIEASSKIDAAGTGGGASSYGGLGAGGGGSGGGILLEAPSVQLAATANLCADGGSGGEGSTDYSGGDSGVPGACTGISGATTAVNGGTGGSGGSGGFSASSGGGGAGAASSMGGGGGGGGAVGWIRIHSPAPTITGSVITPSPLVN